MKNMRGVTCVILNMFCLKLATARYLLVEVEETDKIIGKSSSGFRTLTNDNEKGTVK